MKCDMNCAACIRPATKCHGGSYRTAYTCRDCLPTKKPPPRAERLNTCPRCTAAGAE